MGPLIGFLQQRPPKLVLFYFKELWFSKKLRRFVVQLRKCKKIRLRAALVDHSFLIRRNRRKLTQISSRRSPCWVYIDWANVEIPQAEVELYFLIDLTLLTGMVATMHRPSQALIVYAHRIEFKLADTLNSRAQTHHLQHGVNSSFTGVREQLLLSISARDQREFIKTPILMYDSSN